MEYVLLFLEGIITFISPCLLPMLPIYVSYFAGQSTGDKKNTALINSIGFVLGFTLVFILLGAFAGTIGRVLSQYNRVIQIVTGLIVILFGLNFMDVIRIPFLNMTRQLQVNRQGVGFTSTILFGIIFAVGWTPCVGAFLGSALMLAASGGESLKGILMLLVFSLGLGIPFVLSAVLIDRLKTAFDFIKRNYHVIKLISGGLLVVVGILMVTGFFGYFLNLLAL